jgi:hypothetical protein
MTGTPLELCELSTYSAVVEGVDVKEILDPFVRQYVKRHPPVNWGVDWGPLTQRGALGQEHQQSSFLFNLI